MMLLLLLFALITYSLVCAQPFNLAPAVSVSGVGSGGFVAVQYAVAYSAAVRAFGAIAGGPYFCAQGSASTAATACGSVPQLLDVPSLVASARAFAAAGRIDPLGNLTTQRAYWLAGTADTHTLAAVGQSLESQLRALGVPPTSIASETLRAGHGLPTLAFGSPCAATRAPFLCRCAFDAAGRLLNATLAPLGARRAGAGGRAALLPLPTAAFLPVGVASARLVGLGDRALAYVPPLCRQSTLQCQLHIVFHAEGQSYDAIGDVFVRNAGYIEWAVNNQLILLFPQATASVANGAFDWFGYTGPDYPFQNATQMSTVRRMAQYLGAQTQ